MEKNITGEMINTNLDIFVSVIMPCYNVEAYVGKAIESILDQTYQNFEIVCIDDHSQDNTFRILNNYAEKDSRITVIRNEVNLGVTATRNLLLEKARYDYVINLDSDDYSSKDRLEKFVEQVVLYNADIVSSEYYFIDEVGDTLDIKGLDLLTTPKGVKFVTFFNSPLPNFSLFRKSILKNIKYDERYKAAEDYKILSELYSKDDIVTRVIKEPLYYYRINNNGMSVSNSSAQVESHIRIAREFITNEFGVSGDRFNFWEISKLDNSLQRKSNDILVSLKQISEIRKLYLKKYSLDREEIEEVNQYASQYFLFTYYSLARQGLKNKKLSKALYCIILSFIDNISLLFNLKNMRWIVKKM